MTKRREKSLDLVNGCSYAFPARLGQDPQGANGECLAEIEVDSIGFNLHWPALDMTSLARLGVGHFRYPQMDGKPTCSHRRTHEIAC
jgi:hypothetical protein